MEKNYKIISYLKKIDKHVNEFAIESGVKKSTLYKIESGQQVSPTSANKVAIATGCRIIPKSKYEIGRPRK